MDTAEKNYIRSNPQIYFTSFGRLRRSVSGYPAYVCPLCGYGKKAGQNGITSSDGIHYACWHAGCKGSPDEGGPCDVFDWIGYVEGLQDFRDKFSRAKQIYGLQNIHNTETVVTSKPDIERNTQTNENKTDFSSYYKQCMGKAEAYAYMAGRGISEKICNKYWIGYDPAWVHPKVAGKAYSTPRLILPVTRYAYLARDIRTQISDRQKPYAKMKVGSSLPYNVGCLRKVEALPVFIVEGEIDALSICEMGYPYVIALGSTANVGRLLSMIATFQHTKFIISTDNDDAGVQASRKLLHGLSDIGMTCMHYNLAGEYKDVNARLIADRDGLFDSIKNSVSIFTNS